MEPWDKKLKAMGLPTVEETKKYRETVGWVPYEEYMDKISYHHPGRKFDDFNMAQGYFDKQIEPDRLLREAAYLIGLKHKPLGLYTEEDQKKLEESIYLQWRYLIDEFIL